MIYKTIEDLPLTLNAKEISALLGLSKSNTYKLLGSSDLDFPVLKIGKRLIVPRDKLMIWINNNCGDKK